jgi:acyl carrier protein
MSDVAKKIKLVIAEQAKMKPEEITEKAKFTDDLGLDSLDMIELVMELEEEYGVEISDEDAEKMTTVGEAISYVEKCLSSK